MTKTQLFLYLALISASFAWAQPRPDLPSRPITPAERLENRPHLLPEGTYLSGRNAKLIKRDNDPAWFLALESTTPGKIASNATATVYGGWNYDPNSREPLERPIEILPGKWLATMNNISGNRIDTSITFRVWGEITTYHDRNYLLPSLVTMVSMMDKAEATPPAKNSGNPPPPAQSKALNDPNRDISTNLKAALDAIPRLKPLALPQEVTSGSGQFPAGQSRPAIAGNAPSPRKEGEMVVDRVGRIIFDPDEKCWLFAFEADGNSLAEPPVLLHPCRLLEVMETAAAKATRPVKFRVTGQISKYQSRTYMLARKVLVVYDFGNLRK